MPVAKLSREFYEKFGDKLADELVNCLNSIEASYRAELRDLFDAHFGRFEEKLERRLLDSKAELGVTKAELGIISMPGLNGRRRGRGSPGGGHSTAQPRISSARRAMSGSSSGVSVARRRAVRTRV